MMMERLRQIAADDSLSPTKRLRLMTELAPLALGNGVHVVCVYLHARFVPFARAIIDARVDVAARVAARERTGDVARPEEAWHENARANYATRKYAWWPVHVGGAADRVPLYSVPEVSRDSLPFDDVSDGQSLSDRKASHKPDTNPFTFGHRECVNEYRRQILPSAADPHLLVFYNTRLAPKSAWGADQKLNEFGNLLLSVTRTMSVHVDEADRYDLMTKQFVKNADERLLEELVSECRRFAADARSSGTDTSSASKRVTAFFNWLLHTIGRVLAAPETRLRAYLVGREFDQRWLITKYDRKQSAKPDLALCAIAISGLSAYPTPEKSEKRRFTALRTLLEQCKEKLTERNNLLGKDPSPKANWMSSASDSPTPHPAAGLVTLAAHTGFSVCVEDVNRRYCDLAPLYGPAYAVLDHRVRYNCAIPF